VSAPAWLGDPLLSAFAKLTAILFLALLGASILRRASPSLRHLLLGTAFGLALLLPLASVALPRLELPWLRTATSTRADRAVGTPIAHSPATARVDADRSTSPPGAAPTTGPRSRPAGSWRHRALACYAAIAALLLLRLGAGFARLVGVSRRARRVDDAPGWSRIVRGEAGRRARVALSPEVPVPLTWGVLRPEILLPAESARWSDDEKRRALRHEQAHVERADWLVQCVARVGCAVYWFHPLVWLAARRLSLEAELAADDRVLLSGVPSVDYADQLLRLARRLRGPGLRAFDAPTMARRHQLSIRIDSILNHRPRRSTMSRARILSVTFCSLCALLVLGPARLVPAVSEAHAAGRETTASTERDTAPSTPLIVAASRGDLAAVRRLLDAGADPNEYDDRPVRRFEMMRSPLGTAARLGHLEIVAALLDAGADVDAAPTGDATALMEAAGQGHDDVFELLLARGADVNAMIRGDGTPLIAAARGGHGELVARLLAEGADPDVAVRGDGSPLINAARSGDLESMRLLLDAGAAPERYVPGDETPLYHAIRSGEPEAVRLLLDAGVDVEAEIPGDGNALIVAADRGNEEIVELLLERGARADAGVSGDGNALIVAARDGNYDLVRLLLDSGADVDAGVRGDGNPLIMAAAAGHLDVVELLLDRGADVDRVVPGDENALIRAAEGGHYDVVRALLERGADVNKRVRANGEIRTALVMASRRGHEDVANLLRSSGAVR
jgi:ankyrin repeat protein/beta-lactamase regulating signal transducer with metallopeptidase domain